MNPQTGLDRIMVDNAFAELKKEGTIVSPVRCKWAPAEGDASLVKEHFEWLAVVILKCSMNENNPMKTMAFQKLFVPLQHPRKDLGSHCPFLPCRTKEQLLLPYQYRITGLRVGILYNNDKLKT